MPTDPADNLRPLCGAPTHPISPSIAYPRRHGAGTQRAGGNRPGGLEESVMTGSLDNVIYIDNIYSPNSFRRSHAEKDTPKSQQEPC